MESFNRKFAFSLKLLKSHIFLHFISYGFSALNYTFVFCCKKKIFIIIFLTVQTLLLIFILQMICLLKIFFVPSNRQIKYALNIYAVVFIIFFILVIVQYIFIFQIFNSMNTYKIFISVMGMLYYILDGIIFIREYFTIINQIKNSKSNTTIRTMMQTTSSNNNSEKNCKNETMDSDKTKKIENEKFVNDDTVYVIYGNNNTENNKKRKFKSKNNKIVFNEVNSIISNNDGRNKKIVNKKYYNSNICENDFDSKRKIKINEGKKSFSLKNNKIYFTSVQ